MTTTSERARLRRLATAELSAAETRTIRTLLADAFGPDDEERFTDADWQHSVGGTHIVLDIEGEILAHASVVEREIQVGDVPLRTGYVEAVATRPDRQGEGLGTRVMGEVGSYIEDRFELGVLGTGSHAFYERLGWLTWRGPAFVRMSDGPRRTPDEEGFILVLPTRASPPLDFIAPISCEWRPGDVW